MFGHKTEAEGKVIAVAKVREGFFGDIMGGEKPETWKFVVVSAQRGPSPGGMRLIMSSPMYPRTVFPKSARWSASNTRRTSPARYGC